MPLSSAATPTAPDPSATTPCSCARKRIAVGDLGLGHGDDVGDGAADELERDRTVLEVAGQAVGEGGPGRDRNRLAGVERGAQRGRLRGLDTDDPQRAVGRDAASPMPDASPPPPIGVTIVAISADLIEQLADDRSLPRDHVGIVVGRHEDRAAPPSASACASASS